MNRRIAACLLLLCAACAPARARTATPTVAATQTATPVPVATATPTLPAPTPTPVFQVVIDNVAVDPQGRLYASGFGAPGDDLRHFAQWDGASWVPLGAGFSTAGNSLVTDSAGHLYTESLKDSVQGAAAAILRWDGDKWQEITGDFSAVVDALKPGRVSSNVPVMALAVDGQDNLYAAGSFNYLGANHAEELPMGYVAKWDKEGWKVLGRGFDRVNIRALAVSPAGEVTVAGEQPLASGGISSYIAQWDGERWTQLDTSKLNASLGITLDGSGRFFAGGQGTTPGWLIAGWDGRHWATITDQLAGEAPAVFDMAVDRNGHLYIGGSFESVSGIPARNIAYWDGSAWHGLGDGVNERVEALALDPGGDLYAVGFFTEAGGIPVDHAARWDGESWHPLGR